VSVSGAGSQHATYQSRRSDDQGLRARMREIAETKRRYGCPRIYVRLRREGWWVNHKKVERLYREEGLSLRRRARKKSVAIPCGAIPMPTGPGLCYAMDCVHDRLANGRRFKCLTMTNPCSKEVGRSTWGTAALHSAGETGPECVY
jgi:putative transposase